jgi:hypothetical protein
VPSKRHGFRPGRVLAWLGLFLGAAVLVLGLLLLLFGGALVNSYGRSKAERAFAQTHPGSSLVIDSLGYAPVANRLVAESLTLSGTNLALKVGHLSLRGVGWARWLLGTASFTEVLANAKLEATNVVVEFSAARYGVRCARLRASLRESELVIEGAELQPLVADEELFATHPFRVTRFQAAVPECRVSGLAYDELLQGKAYRAKSIQISRPSFDILVDRDKPVAPFVKPPLMVNEALAAIRQPLQVDRLSVTNGSLTYRERTILGAKPGVLGFGAIDLSLRDIANRGDAGAAIGLVWQSEFMDAALMKVHMTIPISTNQLSLHYSGSLSPMDLTRLNAFLEPAEHTRIRSGRSQEITFEVDVTSGRARGYVRSTYRNLEIAMLDKESGTAKGLENRVESFFVNALKVRNANRPDAAGALKEGKVAYERKPKDEFLQVAWFSLRAGVMDLISF